MLQLLERGTLGEEQLRNVELGLHHEQQHQELILTDLKHGFSCNPMKPAYRSRPHQAGTETPPVQWIEHPGGVARIGHQGSSFSFDNEGPSHRVFLEPHALASRLVTCGEYLEFMADGGYKRPELWLSKGWERLQTEGWSAPLYWEQRDGRWTIFTLDGVRDLDRHEPVCHVSLYEADAYARWTGFRLPTEFEWEVACAPLPVEGNFLETQSLHPRPAQPHQGLAQGFGDVWEWTGSAYAPYPAYRAPQGALGEYNGKFMCSQTVLRGGSCATAKSHARATYRNFFYPEDRWQFSGLRLARDL
jgi:ergothioneine biosynthesis protein EgtB